MNGYLLTVIGTVLVCTLLTAIAPEGKTSAVIKGIAKLVCVLAIIAPVLQFFQTGSIAELTGNSWKNSEESVIEQDEAFIQYYSEKRVRETETALEAELLEEYGVEVQVTLFWQRENEEVGKGYSLEAIRIQCIEMELPEGVGEEVKRAMQTYVEKNYCREVLIE